MASAWERADMQFTYSYNGQSVVVRIEHLPDGRIKALVDDREYVLSASQLADAAWLLQTGEGQHLVYSARDGDERYMHLDGQQFVLEVQSVSQRRRRATSGGDGLVAQMPGQVSDVLVQAGDAVEAGQTLVVLEAMKMEIRVAAVDAGTIKRVLVQVGDVVERGQSLIEMA